MTVKVRHYYRPHGHMSRGHINIEETDLSDEYRSAYDAMLAKGWNFGAEELRTGLISLTIEDRPKGVDVAIRVVQNGPGVQEAMEELLAEVKNKGLL